jgi:hypothetical protein
MNFKTHAPARREGTALQPNINISPIPLSEFLLAGKKYIDVSTSKLAVHSRNDEREICYQAQSPGRLSCLKGHAPDQK